MNIFVFDIETVPDVTSAKRLHEFSNLGDAEIADAMFAMRRAQSGSDFIRHHLQKVVAISCVFRQQDRINVWSLGDETTDEAQLIQRFFDGIDRYTPNLVSWNGGGFDLPVLHYRALLHGIQAINYWETGEHNTTFKWNNYLSRFHSRHCDLMDVLAGYQPRANAPLDEIATMLGFPGKMGMSGSDVWPQYLAGNLKNIRNYCETDVLNTYLVYLRFELMRGQLTPEHYQAECELLATYLEAEQKPHFIEFLQHWQR